MAVLVTCSLYNTTRLLTKLTRKEMANTESSLSVAAADWRSPTTSSSTKRSRNSGTGTLNAEPSELRRQIKLNTCVALILVIYFKNVFGYCWCVCNEVPKRLQQHCGNLEIYHNHETIKHTAPTTRHTYSAGGVGGWWWRGGEKVYIVLCDLFQNLNWLTFPVQTQESDTWNV